MSFENNKLSPQKQINKLATHTSLIEKKSGKIDWNNDASSIYAKFRTFIEWPRYAQSLTKKIYNSWFDHFEDYKSTNQEP